MKSPPTTPAMDFTRPLLMQRSEPLSRLSARARQQEGSLTCPPNLVFRLGPSVRGTIF